MLLCKHGHVNNFRSVIKAIFFQQERFATNAAAATAATVKRNRKPWTLEESKKLIELVKIHGTNWMEIQQHFADRGRKSIGGRYHHMLTKTSGDFQTMLDNDTQFRRNEPWTKKEDDLLIELTSMYGPKWTKITKSFTNRGVPDLAQRYARLKETPEIHRGLWSKKETKELESLVNLYGNDYKKIASLIGTRTVDQCRARYRYLSRRPTTTSNLDKEQIERLKAAFQELGTDNIRAVLRKAQVPVGLKEEDVRQFYWRELEPNIVKSEWTQEEVTMMVQLYNELDGCMELVQSRLPIKRGLKDMWIHYHDYILSKK